jgi:hypothetical protein
MHMISGPVKACHCFESVILRRGEATAKDLTMADAGNAAERALIGRAQLYGSTRLRRRRTRE